MFNTYPVFEKDGELYVADTSSVLTSNPPQYNVYRLSDRKQSYMFCSSLAAYDVKFTMDQKEFNDFKAGKCDAPAEEPKKEEYLSDTERLDWMVLNHARPAQKPDGTWVCEIIRVNGYRSIGDFATYREAIDAAMEDK